MTPDSDRAAIERSLRRRLFAVSFGGVSVTALLMVALVVAGKRDSPVKLIVIGVVCALSISLAVAVIILNAGKRLRPFAADFSKPPDAGERARLKSGIRRLLACELFFAFFFVYGLWQSKDSPWIPLLIGCGISLLLQSVLISSIVRLRKRLKFGETPSRQSL